jgi:hypothetical protein
MTSSQELAVVLVLVALLVVVSTVAGGLWWRLRARALIEVAHLADVLATRLRTLDELLAKLDSIDSDRPAGAMPARRSLLEPAPRSVRIDQPEPTAIAGPTLINVPDLSTGTSESSTAAAAELTRRFGAIWEMAETGASPDAIARGTGHPIGQVELILGLRRQLEAASSGSRPS